MRLWATLCLALAVTGCSENQGPPPPPEPPMVFLVPASTNVVGTSFKVSVNVTGCDIVSALGLEQGTANFKTATYRGPNTQIEVLPGDIARFLPTVGIAANLTLRAHAVCDDGRENWSTPAGVKFFPVVSVVSPANGQGIVMPDSFVAEGGTGATPVTFVGCANTSNGLSLVRVDTAGQVVSFNSSPPFGCDYYAGISEKNASTGQRWLFEPGQGAFAFDSTGLPMQDLNITGGILGDSFTVFATGPDGDALIWDNQASTAPSLTKVRHGNGTTSPANTVWYSMVPGVVNGTPVVDGSTGIALVPSWRVPLGSRSGTQTIQYVNYASGGNPTGELALVTQTFEFLDPANPPQVAITANARTIYIVTPVQGSSSQTNVIACGTQAGSGCQQRWKAGPIDGIVRYLISFAGGTKVAAISENKVWFIDDSMIGAGTILNPNGNPTALSGQLQVSGAQAGLGSDFYLLGGTPFASEIIAFDTPTNGEVYRYSMGGGNTPQTSITMAIDDAGGAWLRIGVNQVRPSPLADYRAIRGATP